MKKSYKELLDKICSDLKISHKILAKQIGVSQATLKRKKSSVTKQNVTEKTSKKIDNFICNHFKVKSIEEIFSDVLNVKVTKGKILNIKEPNDSLNSVGSPLTLENIADNIKEEKGLSIENIDLRRKVQRLRDENTVLRKVTRERFRAEEPIRDVIDKLLYQIDTINRPTITDYISTIPNQSKLVIHLSDWHIGQKVDLRNNKFCYEVAIERINKLFLHCQNEILSDKIKDVYIIMTGDMFNLDSRMDQLLTSEDNRASSLLRGTEIIEQFIYNLLKLDINLHFMGCVGNESRVRGDEYASSVDSVAINSFDYILFQTIKRRFKDTVIFLNDCQYLQDAVQVGDVVFGFTHGDKFKVYPTYPDISRFKSLLKVTTKLDVDYAIWGHIHAAIATDNFARSGSLVGANAYSVNGLGIPESRASQNIFKVIGKNIIPMIIFLE